MAVARVDEEGGVEHKKNINKEANCLSFAKNFGYLHFKITKLSTCEKLSE